MTAAAQPAISTRPFSVSPAKKISWEDFQRKYLSREDHFKYEWVNGEIQKTLRTMDQSQIFLFRNLVRFLYKLKAKKPDLNGDLVAETDSMFAHNHRQPDIAWFSDEQMEASRRGENSVPAFVIEVISKNDQVEMVEEKMDNYHDAGVKVVWQIFPRQNKVVVFNNLQKLVCRGNDVCSAEPVIPGFLIPVSDIFK